MAEIIGGVAVEIVGDYSKLQQDMDAAVGVAQSGAGKISDAIESAFTAPDASPITNAMEGIATEAQQVAQKVAEAFADVQIQMPSGSIISDSAAADIAKEIATAFESNPISINIDTSTAGSAAQEVAGEIAAAFGNQPLTIDTSEIAGSLANLVSAAQADAEQIAGSLSGIQGPDLTGGTVSSPEMDISAAEASLQQLEGDAQQAATQMAQDFAGEAIPALDTSAAEQSLQSIDDAAQTAMDQLNSDLSGTAVPALDVSAPEASLMGLDDAAQTAMDTLAQDVSGVAVPGLDVSQAEDSLTGLDTAAQTAMDAVAQDVAGIAVPAIDTTTAVDSLSTLDDAAKTTGQDVDAAFSGPVEPPDFGPVNSAFNEALASAQTAGQQLVADLFSSGDVTTAADAMANEVVSALDKINAATGQSSLGDYAAQLQDLLEKSQALAGPMEEVATSSHDVAGGLTDLVSAADGVGSGLGNIDQELQNAAQSEEAFAKGAQDIQGSTGGIQSAIQGIGDSVTNLTTELSGAIGQLAAFGGITLGAAGIKQFAESMAEATDSITKADIALTVLTGDADKARGEIGQLEQLALSDGLQMPGLLQAAQSMTALLPEGANVVGILNQLADASALTGRSIDGLANTFDRIVNSSSVSARQLSQLGLDMKDLQTAMQDVGASFGGFGDNVQKAFGALDQHDKIIVLQDALTKLQGVAQDVANNTFAGQWHQAAAQWDIDLAAMGEGMKPFISDLGGLKGAVNDVAVVITSLGSLFKTAGDAIGGLAAAIVNAVGGIVKAVIDSATSFSKGWQDLKDAFTNTGSALKSTWDSVSNDFTAGGATVDKILGNTGQAALATGEYMRQAAVPASQYAASLQEVDNKGKTLADTAMKMGQAFQQVATFENQIGTAPGVQALQRDFENAGKAIDMVAKQSLPTAITAVTDYVSALAQGQAPTDTIAAGFTKVSTELNQLGKTDAPGAVQGFEGLFATFSTAGGTSLPLVTAAFDAVEKSIENLGKSSGWAAADAAQKEFIDQMKDLGASSDLMSKAFDEDTKILTNLAKDALQPAIDGFTSLEAVMKTGTEPTQQLTDTFQKQLTLIQQLGSKGGDLQNIADQIGALEQRESEAGEPIGVLTQAFDAQRKVFEQMASAGSLTQAADNLNKLISAEQAANAPTNELDATYNTLIGTFQKMANAGNFQTAIDGINNLATAQKNFDPTGTDFANTLDKERGVIDQFAGTSSSGLTAAIGLLSKLADTQSALQAPSKDITATLDDERSKLVQLGGSDTQAAIKGLSDLADQQVRLKQPSDDVTKTLDTERSEIEKLGGSNITQAIGLMQQLIDKQIAMKQPTDDVQASIKALNDLLAKQVNADLPAAIAAHQKYIDELSKEGDIYKALNAAGIQTVQQQEYQIAAEQQLLASMNDTNSTLGDRLKLQQQILQNEVNLSTATGADANAQVLALEGVRLEYQKLATDSHGYADAAVAALNDINKGFDSLGQTMGQAIVNGNNLADALVGAFKKIAASVLGDLIQGALTPLKSSLLELEDSLIKGIDGANKVVGQTAEQVAESMKNEADAINATVGGLNAAGGAATTTSGAMTTLAATSTTAAGSLASLAVIVGAVAGVIGAIAGVIGDVYLAQIDSKLFHIETSEVEIRNTLENARADAWSQYNDMYDRLGEVLGRLNTIMDNTSKIAAALAGGVGGGGGNSADQDAMVALLTTIKGDTDAMVGNGNDQLTMERQIDNDIVSGTQQLNSELSIIDTDINAVTAALLYGGAKGSQDLANSFHANSMMVADAISEGAAQVSGRLPDPAGIESRGNAAVSAAHDVAGQIAALGQEYQQLIAASDAAAKQGNADLATQYRDAANAVMLQIAGLEEGQNVQTGIMSQSAAKTESQLDLDLANAQAQLQTDQQKLAFDQANKATADQIKADTGKIAVDQTAITAAQNALQQYGQQTSQNTGNTTTAVQSGAATMGEIFTAGAGSIVAAVNASAATIANAVSSAMASGPVTQGTFAPQHPGSPGGPASGPNSSTYVPPGSGNVPTSPDVPTTYNNTGAYGSPLTSSNAPTPPSGQGNAPQYYPSGANAQGQPGSSTPLPAGYGDTNPNNRIPGAPPYGGATPPVPHFQDGGLALSDGIGIVEKGENVLTPDQTAAIVALGNGLQSVGGAAAPPGGASSGLEGNDTSAALAQQAAAAAAVADQINTLQQQLAMLTQELMSAMVYGPNTAEVPELQGQIEKVQAQLAALQTGQNQQTTQQQSNAQQQQQTGQTAVEALQTQLDIAKQMLAQDIQSGATADKIAIDNNNIATLAARLQEAQAAATQAAHSAQTGTVATTQQSLAVLQAMLSTAQQVLAHDIQVGASTAQIAADNAQIAQIDAQIHQAASQTASSTQQAATSSSASLQQLEQMLLNAQATLEADKQAGAAAQQLEADNVQIIQLQQQIQQAQQAQVDASAQSTSTSSASLQQLQQLLINAQAQLAADKQSGASVQQLQADNTQIIQIQQQILQATQATATAANNMGLSLQTLAALSPPSSSLSMAVTNPTQANLTGPASYVPPPTINPFTQGMYGGGYGYDQYFQGGPLGGGLPGYDLGGPVPSDQIAMLHGGEYVIPPAGQFQLPANVLARLQLPQIPQLPSLPFLSPSGGGGANVTQSWNLTFNGVTNARDIAQQLQNLMRTSGVGLSFSS